MISVTLFTFGFVLYVIFNLLTADFAARTDLKMNKGAIVFFIFIYYTLLAMYYISIIGKEESGIVLFVENLIYIIPCALILFNYYKKQIKPQDDKLYGQVI
jgi:hypothetical protein